MKTNINSFFGNISGIFCIALFFFSCSSPNGSLKGLFHQDFVDMASFKERMGIEMKLELPPSSLQQHLLDSLELNVRYAYQLSEQAPLWFDLKGIKEGAKEMVFHLDELKFEGLDPKSYQRDYIQHIVERLKDPLKNIFPTDSIVRWDIVLTNTYLSAARDLILGRSLVNQVDKGWYIRNDTVFNGASFLVKSIMGSSHFPSWDTFRPVVPEYSKMVQAVRVWSKLQEDTVYRSLKEKVCYGQDHPGLQELIYKELGRDIPKQPDSVSETVHLLTLYQYYHQLKVTGEEDSATCAVLQTDPEIFIEQLLSNMERLRALPRDIGVEYIWVNIPLMEVRYAKEGRTQFMSRGIIGSLSRKTPSLNACLTNIVFNPPWGVPPTILKQDVGPGIGRSGTEYLRRKGLRAIDAQGKDVTDEVTVENYRRFAYRQPPGAHNALGEVKFNLPNKWDIYLHDTPHINSFSLRNRALSSGCVRVQRARDLAAIILDNKDYDSERIDSIIQTRRTKLKSVSRAVPVYIVYLTVATDSTGTHLRYLNDIYAKDQELHQALVAMQPVVPR